MKHIWGLLVFLSVQSFAAEPPECRNGFLIYLVNEFIVMDVTPPTSAYNEYRDLFDKLKKDGKTEGAAALKGMFDLSYRGFVDGLRSADDKVQNRIFRTEENLERAFRLTRANQYGEVNFPPLQAAFPLRRKIEIPFDLGKFEDLAKTFPAKLAGKRKYAFTVIQERLDGPTRLEIEGDPAHQANVREMLNAYRDLQSQALPEMFRKIHAPDAGKNPGQAARFALAQALQAEVAKERLEDVVNWSASLRDIGRIWEEIAKDQGICNP